MPENWRKKRRKQLQMWGRSFQNFVKLGAAILVRKGVISLERARPGLVFQVLLSWVAPLVFMLGKSHGPGAWQAAVHGLTSVGYHLATKPPVPPSQLPPKKKATGRILCLCSVVADAHSLVTI